MAIRQPNQPVQTQQTQGRASGGGIGQLIGAGLGAVVGGATGGPGGALAGASAGGGLGATIGGAVQPGEQGQVEQSQIQNVPTLQVAQQSQQLADGIRALNNSPSLAKKFGQSLTQAYMNTQMELKRRN